MAQNNITEIKKGQTGTVLLIENDGFASLYSSENKGLCESIKINENTGRRELPNPFVFSAVFQKYGIENANGRIYPEKVLKREVEKYQQAIRERRAYGECNHPESSTIDLSRIALNIIELHWEGHTLVGKIELPISDGFRNLGIVSTCADTVAQWLISGLKIGVSSRGLGSVTQQMGKLVVDDDYEITCWDAVSSPSTPNAWITNNEQELRTYVEDKQSSKNVIKEDKYTKFENWLQIL